jgi:hypothetical protein
MSNLRRFFFGTRAPQITAAALALCGAAGPGMAQAQAQGVPSYARPEAPPPVPSYARRQEVLRGRVTATNGKYGISVRDDRGFVDTVTLHDGTVIIPRGFRLAPGVTVTIYGHNGGNVFNADEIDTPYRRYY